MVAYSFKKQFVVPIQVGLGLKISWAAKLVVTPKRQTIRSVGKRRHARVGETVQLYQGMRTKDCFLIGTAVCTKVSPITIDVLKHRLIVTCDGSEVVPLDMAEFACSDGFENSDEMLAFWQTEHGLGIFQGLRVEWHPVSK